MGKPPSSFQSAGRCIGSAPCEFLSVLAGLIANGHALDIGIAVLEKAAHVDQPSRQPQDLLGFELRRVFLEIQCDLDHP